MNKFNEATKRFLSWIPKPYLYDYNRPTEEEVKAKQEELGEDWIVTKGCGKFLVFKNLK